MSRVETVLGNAALTAGCCALLGGGTRGAWIAVALSVSWDLIAGAARRTLHWRQLR